MANIFKKAVDNFRDRLRIGANNEDMNIATDLDQQMVIRERLEEQAMEDALKELSEGDTLETDDYIGISPAQKESLKKLNDMLKHYQSAYFVGSFNESNPVASIGFNRKDVYKNEHFKAELKDIDKSLEASLNQKIKEDSLNQLHRKVQAMVNHVSWSEELYDQAVNKSYGEVDDLLDKREKLQKQVQKEALELGEFATKEFDQLKNLNAKSIVYSMDQVLDIENPTFKIQNEHIKETHKEFLQQSPYYDEEAVKKMSFEDKNEKLNVSAENAVASTIKTAKLMSKDLTSEKEDPLVMQEMHDEFENRRNALRDTYLISRTIVSPMQAESVVRMLDEQSEVQVFDVVAEAVRTGADIGVMAVPGMATLAQALDPVYDEMDKNHPEKGAKRTDFIGAAKSAIQVQKMNQVTETEEERLLRQEQLEADSPLKMPKL